MFLLPISGMLNRKLREIFSLVCTLGNLNIAITIRQCNLNLLLCENTQSHLALWYTEVHSYPVATNWFPEAIEMVLPLIQPSSANLWMQSLVFMSHT